MKERKQFTKEFKKGATRLITEQAHAEAFAKLTPLVDLRVVQRSQGFSR